MFRFNHLNDAQLFKRYSKYLIKLSKLWIFISKLLVNFGMFVHTVRICAKKIFKMEKISISKMFHFGIIIKYSIFTCETIYSYID